MFEMILVCRVQSAQQFQALQAQYSGAYPTPHFHNPEGPTGAVPMLNMFNPEAPVDQQEAANPTKRTAGFFYEVYVTV